MKGKIIVLEGIDGSGKGTQFQILKEKLSEKYPVRTLDFPQYDSYFGKQIARYLRGEFGNLDEVPVEVPVLLYALDRYQALPKLQNWLSKGYVILLNRYTTSSLAYQAAKLPAEKQNYIIDWIELVEARLPKPDLVVLLDIPEDAARNLVMKKKERGYLKGSSMDIHEKDLSYQQNVAALYRKIASSRPEWVVVSCYENGSLLPPSEISERILSAVSKIFNDAEA